MASPFKALTAVAAATHDRIMGDTFEYRPMKADLDKNAPRIVDPDRAVTTFIAPFVDGAARAHAGPFREPGVQPERPGHATSRPFVSLDMSRLPYKATRGDLIFSAEKSQLFSVAEIVPSSPGFVRLDLNRI